MLISTNNEVWLQVLPTLAITWHAEQPTWQNHMHVQYLDSVMLNN